MNLASPAPEVEPAFAEKPSYAEEAIADKPEQSEPVVVPAVEEVDPAVTYDDPRHFAPNNVKFAETPGPSPISTEGLRGKAGSEFESYAAVFRGAPEKNFLKRCLPCIYDERDFITYGEVKRYILVKGSTCFVFLEASDPHPQYAIPLEDLYPVLEDPNHPETGSVTVSPAPGTNKPREEMVTILLKNKQTKTHTFQITFDTSQDSTLGERFYDVAMRAGSKKSGPVTTSVIEAQRVGKEAAKAQPEI